MASVHKTRKGVEKEKMRTMLTESMHSAKIVPSVVRVRTINTSWVQFKRFGEESPIAIAPDASAGDPEVLEDEHRRHGEVDHRVCWDGGEVLARVAEELRGAVS
jgi:hypothetical protein